MFVVKLSNQVSMNYCVSIYKPVLFSIFLWCCVVAQAQEQRSVISRAEDAYVRNEFATAAKLYEHVVQGSRKPDINVLTKMADCYWQINDYHAACNSYQQLTTIPGSPAVNWLYYGEMLKCMGKYVEAKIAFREYEQREGQSAAIQKAGCDSALVWMANTPVYTVRNLQTLNTTKADWGARIYGEKHLVFVSDSLREWQMRFPDTKVNKEVYRRTDYSYQKIYVTDTTNRGLDISYVHDFSPAMNEFTYHTGPVSFSGNGDSAYFTVTYFDKTTNKKDKVVKSGHTVMYGTRRLEIYLCIKDPVTQRWRKAQPFAYNNATAYSVGHAVPSSDGKVLYFTSDMPGGKGGLDIWYCDRVNDSTWGMPKNCGAINTVNDEAFPTIGADDLLYFSSKGHIGMGGYDIFSAKGQRQNWTVPHNLGYPVNSPGDDFYFVPNDLQSGFFASNRAGGLGDDDIYTYTLPKDNIREEQVLKVLTMLNTVYDATDNSLIPGAQVSLRKVQPGGVWRKQANEKGITTFILEQQQQYVIAATATGYTADSIMLSTPVITRSDTLYTKVYLKKELPHRAGDMFVLKDLYYDFDKFNIRSDAAKVLDGLLDILRKYPNITIELSSHTDSRGTAAYNMVLSDKRAQSAKAYLVEKGIAADRIEAKGYGDTKLLNRCGKGVVCSEEEHQLNRRTEVRILKE